MKVVEAVGGIGVALLPHRRESFFGAFLTISLIEGRSGDDDISIRESCWIVLLGDENLECRVAIENRPNVSERMRRAHSNLCRDSRIADFKQTE